MTDRLIDQDLDWLSFEAEPADLSRDVPSAILMAKAIDLADSPAILQLADRLAPALKRRFLAAVKQLQSTINLEGLARAIEANQLTAAEAMVRINAFPEIFGEMAVDLKAGFLVGAGLASRELARSSIDLGFNIINPRAVAFANSYLPQIVQPFQQDAKELIRDFVSRSLNGEMTPMEAAQDIRDLIGLDPRRARAADKFWESLLEEGVPDDKIERRVGRYMQALLKQRAEVIARTEITRAAVKGERDTWEEAANRGLYDPSKYVRVWMATEDDRLCDECEPLDETEVEMDEEFPGGDPPLHPNCRCTVNRVKRG